MPELHNSDEKGSNTTQHSITPVEDGGNGATETSRTALIATWASILGGIAVVVAAATYIAVLRHDLDQAINAYGQLCKSMENAEADILDSVIRTARVIGPAVGKVDLTNVPSDVADRHNAAFTFFESVKDWPLSSETQNTLRTVQQGDTRCG